MNSLPKISVIICTYNHAQYIKKAIDSVLNQAYQDFEIIVVDDGSTDNTKNIVNHFGNSIKYIYQDNRGLASARNTGIHASKGEFVTFLDADDYYLKENLKIKILFLENNPQVSWVYSDWQYFDEKGNYLEKGSVRFRYANKNLNNKNLNNKLFERLLYKRNFISCCAAVVKKSVLEDVGYFDPNVICLEDYDILLRISLKHPVYYINEVSLMVRDIPGSLSKDFNKQVSGNAVIVDKLETLIPNDFPDKKRFLNRKHADKYMYLAQSFVKMGQYKSALNAYWQSIKRLPLQKRIYWCVLLLVFQSIKAHACHSIVSKGVDKKAAGS
jgi:glycosyltransferase involved in cell wall biosynthesis